MAGRKVKGYLVRVTALASLSVSLMESCYDGDREEEVAMSHC